MLRDINPTVVFLIETKLQGCRMEKVRHKCGFPNGIDVDSDGRSGGLSLGWSSDCKITLRSFSRRHIDVMIEEDSEGKT
ncbi:Exo_endo_phos domain-containing protein [Gossypium australe]|uniref:Exo_endo_phos domain-containing protein n=1 Tax=Gossypium australe TaxID=47621 RepID=A0A5B6VJA7_9ROSI|nr:Exo_endo_phos domain-containing protein [Gossypium australe]